MITYKRLGVLNIFIVVIIHLLLVLFLLFKKSALYNKWVKILVLLYYIPITIIFINGYHRINEKYNMYDGPVINEGWEVKSKWASFFSYAFIAPIGILVLYTIIRKIKPMEKSRWIHFIITLLLSIIILFVLFVLFNIVYGISP